MKIMIFITILLVTMFVIPAGSGISAAAESSTAPGGGKILIAYFSWANNTGVSDVDALTAASAMPAGNTETIANMIADAVGGDLFKIRTVTPYPKNYNKCTDLAAVEQRNNARPELSAQVADLDGYDVIFLGYPVWWGTMPMAMFTFLEKHNLSGKKVIPFCTHEGSALGRSEGDIASLCPGAVLTKGLAVRGSVVKGAQADVDRWIRGLNLLG